MALKNFRSILPFKEIDGSIGNMFLATVFFFFMSLSVKLLKDIPTSQIVFFRAWVAFALCFIALKKKNIPLWGTHKKLLLLRGIFGTAALIAYFSSIKHLPLATASILQNLSPLFTAIFAVLFLQEKLFFKQWLFFALAFLGVMIIQGFDFSGNNFYLFMGIFGSVASAAAYTCIGKIGGKEHSLVIMMYFPLVTVPCILPTVIMEWKNPTLMEWAYLFLIGIFVQIAQYFMTKSFQFGKNSKVSIVSYFGVILSMVVGYLFFAEAVELHIIIGALLILFAISANTVVKN